MKPGNDAATGCQLGPEDVNDDIRTQFANGSLTAPKPFALIISVRSEKHRQVIERDVQAAQVVFREYEDWPSWHCLGEEYLHIGQSL